MQKKVIVVGGGIAGLSAGVYAAKCGFNATVIENHSIAGGNCTSWRRKDYLFEGGMHWLTGSGEKEYINRSWRYIGALDDSVKILTPEPFIEYDYNGTPIKFYRDVDKTEQHFLEIAPEDSKEIKRFCNNIRKVKNLSMPLFDLKGVEVTKKTHPSLSLLFTAITAGTIMSRFARITKEEYLNRFKNEGLKAALSSCLSEKTGVLPIFFTLGTLSRGDGGFPEGGSLPFVERIVEKFTSLGGELLLGTRVTKVIVENNKVVGVIADDKRLDADAVIIAADTMAIDNLFDIPLKSEWLDRMKKVTEPTMAVLISLGINADLRKYNKGLIFKTDETISIDKQKYDYISVNNYANDSHYSPPGKSAITIGLDGDTYDFWKKARELGNYTDEKKRVADLVIEAISKAIPEIKGNVEVVDVATPLTYERYCGNWKGSWMTEMVPSMKMDSYPAVIEGLSGLYFAGQRMMPPGGLPVALSSARTAVQYLCRDTDTIFISED